MDEVPPIVLGLELTIDGIFFADVVLTFFSAYEMANGLETNKSSIAQKYFRTWFFIDMISW